MSSTGNASGSGAPLPETDALLHRVAGMISGARALPLSSSVKLDNKDEILELYLNQIALGRRSFGIQAASRAYFAKDVGELDIAQAAYLAILPKALAADFARFYTPLPLLAARCSRILNASSAFSGAPM